MEAAVGKSDKKKAKKQRKKIFFDDEIIKKENAPKVPLQTDKQEVKSRGINEKLNKNRKKGQKRPAKEINSEATVNKSVKKEKKKNELTKGNDNSNTEHDENDQVSLKKNKRNTLVQKMGEDVEDPEKPVETSESIRAQKRKKYAKLLEDMKCKSELTAQQNALNYLSKWKHTRDQWKFEKLKQVWLQQNLFHLSKIPNEFWNTTVDYFSGAKGAIRDKMLADALKIIECEDHSVEEDVDEDHQQKLIRARDIVQNLQE